MAWGGGCLGHTHPPSLRVLSRWGDGRIIYGSPPPPPLKCITLESPCAWFLQLPAPDDLTPARPQQALPRSGGGSRTRIHPASSSFRGWPATSVHASLWSPFPIAGHSPHLPLSPQHHLLIKHQSSWVRCPPNLVWLYLNELYQQ